MIVRVLVAWIALVAVAGAAPWETTRRTVIDPLNSALHRNLPKAIKARDLTAVLGFYATETGTGLTWAAAREQHPGREEALSRWEGDGGPEPIRERYRRLLELFPTVDKAELRIDRVEWRTAGADGYPAIARLQVRGALADGRRAQLEQTVRWHLAPAPHGGWQVMREEVTARTLVTRRRPRYADAAAAGIVNVHTHEGSPPFRLFGGGDDNPVRASAGAAVADVDRDGCDDVFLAGSPDAALYRNRCDGTFLDVTVAAGLPRPYPAVATSALFFDYDNDGWPDLFVGAITGGERLFRNLGGGRFTDVTAAAGIGPGRWASSAAAADYDHDGFLDLYVARMGDYAHTVPEPNFDAANGLPDTLLRNRGDGTFADVSRHAGVARRGWDLAAAWGDYDGDGWPDLYVANEFGANALYRNERDGTFSERAEAAGVTDGGAGMGVAWGDYDADGDLDLYVSNMHANSAWALFHPDFPAPIPRRYRLLGLLFPREIQRRADLYIERLTRGSSLFRNEGNGTFTDVSDAAGVRDAQWGWGIAFLDYDNDGRLDLYAVNGFISGPILDDV